MGGENRGWALSPFRVILLYREIGNKTEKWVRKIGRPYLRLFDLFRFVDCFAFFRRFSLPRFEDLFLLWGDFDDFTLVRLLFRKVFFLPP